MTCGPYAQWVIGLFGFFIGVLFVFVLQAWISEQRTKSIRGDSWELQEYQKRHQNRGGGRV